MILLRLNSNKYSYDNFVRITYFGKARLCPIRHAFLKFSLILFNSERKNAVMWCNFKTRNYIHILLKSEK